MIVSDLNFISIPIFPSEADSPLIIDPYAVLPHPVSQQSFKSIPWGNSQIIDVNRIFQETKFSPSNLENIAWKTFYPMPIPNTLCLLIPEALYHSPILAYFTNSVKH